MSRLDLFAAELADIQRACARGYFTPDEDERVRCRFARYLSARAGLLQTIDELKPIAMSRDDESAATDEALRLRAFAVAYATTALLVRAGRFIVDQYAPNRIVQRKLNEAEPRLGIPRKQFTEIYRSLTAPSNAWRIEQAMRFAAANRQAIEALGRDDCVACVIEHLREAEESLRVSIQQYLKARLRYRLHSLRRRRASAMAQAMFALFEYSGRIIADVRNPWHTKRVTPEIQQKLSDLLQPGDVLISRHDDAMSNLFLPGYWVHASLHIGDAAARQRLGVEVDHDRAARWIGPVRVLEARKDGVLFRPLSQTLAVDAVAVIRPTLASSHLAQALSRAVTHEGKLYDFEFDFFRSDRLVCTEVVYRGFHGVGGLEFQLKTRAGRPTLAAEDLLDMALRGEGFEPVAVFGAPGCGSDVLTGQTARAAIIASMNHCRGE